MEGISKCILSLSKEGIMLKKRSAKKAAREAKEGVSWFAKKEAQIAITALATILTQRAFQKAAKKYPALRFLKNKDGKAI
jgi:hypothetical protein